MRMPSKVRGMRPNYKTFLLATVAALAADAGSSVAFAEQAAVQAAAGQQASGEQASGQPAQPTSAEPAADSANSTNKLSEVVVTGYRKALGEARDIKKASDIQEDVIVADDIAKFPELNLAESLQRLPGVEITREAGEGRRISLRGLGPDYTRVQLNGMEVLGNVDSAQDSRGQRSRDRAFDFNIFASELFTKVVVEKTFQAAQNEGGMAGTLGLFTGKPFDYGPGFEGAFVFKGGTNTYTDDFQPRLVAFVSQNWDNKFGATFSVSYGTRNTTEQGHNDYNYNQPDAATMQAMVANGLDISHLTAAQQAKFLSGDLLFADGNRISSWDARQYRLGVTGALQWKPVDNFKLTLDMLYSDFNTHRDEYHLATRPLNGEGSGTFDTPAGAPWGPLFQTASVVNNLTWDKNNYVTMTNVSNVTFGSEHRREFNENTFTQAVLTGTWDVSNRLSIDGHGGAEMSIYDTPYDDKLYLRAKGNLIANYGANGQSASFQYPGTNLTNPAIYETDDFYYRAFNNASKLQEGVLNLHYKVTDEWTLRGGVAYHHFAQDGENEYYDSNVNGTNAKTQGASVADITDVFTNNFGSWLVGDFTKAFDKYHEYHRLGPNVDGTGGMIQDIEQVFTVSEGTFSGYVQMDWDSQAFGKRFRGNIGLRGYDTNTESKGKIETSVPGDNYVYVGTADIKGHYAGALPAMNSVLELDKDVLLRFSATQNLNRPTLSSLAAEGSASQDDTSGKITASRGNPNLKPFTDTTLDLSLEYYFGRVGLLSAGVFEKYIKNFIVNQAFFNVPFSKSGIPVSTIPGATGATIIEELDYPINLPDTHEITGAELAAQRQLSFLPAPFNNLGVVANYTYVDAGQLPGFSRISYNATLYYETALYGARVALNHRTRWYTGYDNSSPTSTGTQGFLGSTYVDAAAFWNVTPKLQFTFDAINLTNQKDTQFWGQPLYLYNQTQSGTTFLAGLRYKF